MVSLVFTIPKMLRGIFRKRRYLLDHLFKTATESVRDRLRVQLTFHPGPPDSDLQQSHAEPEGGTESWNAPELPLDAERLLILDAQPAP